MKHNTKHRKTTRPKAHIIKRFQERHKQVEILIAFKKELLTTLKKTLLADEDWPLVFQNSSGDGSSQEEKIRLFLMEWFVLTNDSV